MLAMLPGLPNPTAIYWIIMHNMCIRYDIICSATATVRIVFIWALYALQYYILYITTRINKVIDNVCCFFFRYLRRIRIFCFSNALNSPRKLVSNKVLFLCKSFCCVNSSAVVCIKLDDSIWTLICTKIVKIKNKHWYLISKIKIKKNIYWRLEVLSVKHYVLFFIRAAQQRHQIKFKYNNNIIIIFCIGINTYTYK